MKRNTKIGILTGFIIISVLYIVLFSPFRFMTYSDGRACSPYWIGISENKASCNVGLSIQPYDGVFFYTHYDDYTLPDIKYAHQILDNYSVSCSANVTFLEFYTPDKCNKPIVHYDGVFYVQDEQILGCRIPLPYGYLFTCTNALGEVVDYAGDYRYTSAVQFEFSKKVCAVCDEPTEWSECVDNTQTRTVHICSEETDFECVEETDIRICSTAECVLASDCEDLTPLCEGDQNFLFWVCVDGECVSQCKEPNTCEDYGYFTIIPPYDGAEFTHEVIEIEGLTCYNLVALPKTPNYFYLWVVLGGLILVLAVVLIWRFRK